MKTTLAPNPDHTMYNLPSRGLCPHCERALIVPTGLGPSPYLIVVEQPTIDDVVTGRAGSLSQKKDWKGRPSGINGWGVLDQELRRAGLSLGQFRLTNLWLHSHTAKSPKLSQLAKAFMQEHGLTVKEARERNPKLKIKEGACDIDWHVNQLSEEFAGRTHVLLMGSAITEALLGEKVRTYIGLPVKIHGFNKVHFWVGPNPGHAISQPLGELRLAVERFAEDIRKSKK